MTTLLLLALLPLDVAPPRPAPTGRLNGLTLEAALDDEWLVAKLTNTSDKPQKLYLGLSCSGPEPFEALVDGVAKPFATVAEPCSGNAMLVETLAPGARRTVRSQVRHDGRARRLQVRYRVDAQRMNTLATDGVWTGALTSPPIEAAPTLEVTLDKVVTNGLTVSFEIAHVYRGTRSLRFVTGWKGVCAAPEDVLLVDGMLRGLSGSDRICDGPVVPEVQTLAPGQRFVTQGRVALTAGRHRVLARYRVEPSRAEVGASWFGSVDSPEILVEVRP